MVRALEVDEVLAKAAANCGDTGVIPREQRVQTFLALLEDAPRAKTEHSVNLAAACTLLLASDTRLICSTAPSAVDALLDVLEANAKFAPMPVALAAAALTEASTESDGDTLARKKRALDITAKACAPQTLSADQEAWRSQLLATTRVLHEESLPSQGAAGRVCSRIVNAKSPAQRMSVLGAIGLALVVVLFTLWVILNAASSLWAGESAGPRSLSEDAHKFLPILLLIAYVTVSYKSSATTMPRTTTHKIKSALSRNVVQAHFKAP